MIHDTRYDAEYGKDREVLTCKQTNSKSTNNTSTRKRRKSNIYLSNNLYFVLSKNNYCTDI